MSRKIIRNTLEKIKYLVGELSCVVVVEANREENYVCTITNHNSNPLEIRIEKKKFRVFDSTGREWGAFFSTVEVNRLAGILAFALEHSVVPAAPTEKGRDKE